MVDTRSERALRLHQSEVAVFRKLEIVISKFRGLTSNSKTRAQAPCPIHSKIEVCTLLSLPNPCFAALVASQSEIPPKKQNISKSFLALYVTCVARSQLKNATTHTHTIFKRKKNHVPVFTAKYLDVFERTTSLHCCVIFRFDKDSRLKTHNNVPSGENCAVINIESWVSFVQKHKTFVL